MNKATSNTGQPTDDDLGMAYLSVSDDDLSAEIRRRGIVLDDRPSVGLPMPAPDDLLVGFHVAMRGQPARYYVDDRVLLLSPDLTEPEQRAEIACLFGEPSDEIMAKVAKAAADEVPAS